MSSKLKTHYNSNDMNNTYCDRYWLSNANWTVLKAMVTCELCRKKLGLQPLIDDTTISESTGSKAQNNEKWVNPPEALIKTPQTTIGRLCGELLPWDLDDKKYEYFTHETPVEGDETWSSILKLWNSDISNVLKSALIRRKRVLQGSDLVGRICSVADTSQARAKDRAVTFTYLRTIKEYSSERTLPYKDENCASFAFAYPVNMDALNKKYNKKENK